MQVKQDQIYVGKIPKGLEKKEIKSFFRYSFNTIV